MPADNTHHLVAAARRRALETRQPTRGPPHPPAPRGKGRLGPAPERRAPSRPCGSVPVRRGLPSRPPASTSRSRPAPGGRREAPWPTGISASKHAMPCAPHAPWPVSAITPCLADRICWRRSCPSGRPACRRAGTATRLRPHRRAGRRARRNAAARLRQPPGARRPDRAPTQPHPAVHPRPGLPHRRRSARPRASWASPTRHCSIDWPQRAPGSSRPTTGVRTSGRWRAGIIHPGDSGLTHRQVLDRLLGRAS
jgi:hypothetical protein